MDPNVTSNATNETIVHFCMQVLVEQFPQKSVRYWDVAIILPNVVFVAFLVYKFRRIVQKLSSTRTPLFRVFFAVVYLIAILGIVRCIVSMAATATNTGVHVLDKVLWLLLKWTLLAAELFFLTFALMFGHLDSNSSLKRVLLITLLVSGVFSVVQGVSEFATDDEHFTFKFQEFDLFSHGGMVFWTVTSSLCALMYALPLIIPRTPLRRYLLVPQRRRFYVYCTIMALLNVVQVIGTGMVLWGDMMGMCVVDLTSYMYFCFFAPIVYVVFLKNFVPNAAMDGFFAHRHPKDDHQPLDDRDEDIFDAATTAQYYQRFNNSRGLRISAAGNTNVNELEDSVPSTSVQSDWLVQSANERHADDIVTHHMDAMSAGDDEDILRTSIVSPNPLFDYAARHTDQAIKLTFTNYDQQS